jgi:hypothetical protein
LPKIEKRIALLGWGRPKRIPTFKLLRSRCSRDVQPETGWGTVSWNTFLTALIFPTGRNKQRWFGVVALQAAMLLCGFTVAAKASITSLVIDFPLGPWPHQ